VVLSHAKVDVVHPRASHVSSWSDLALDREFRAERDNAVQDQHLIDGSIKMN